MCYPVDQVIGCVVPARIALIGQGIAEVMNEKSAHGNPIEIEPLASGILSSLHAIPELILALFKFIRPKDFFPHKAAFIPAQPIA